MYMRACTYVYVSRHIAAMYIATDTIEGTCTHVPANGVSGSVLSKTAIFPKNKGRKREISNESARGSSVRKANV